MLLKDYFEQMNGTGVLATADANGIVNSAIYAKPHVTENGQLVFLMRERTSYSNIRNNPAASFMFIESGAGYKGLRLRLQKVGEEVNEQLLAEMTRSWISRDEDVALGPKHLVVFAVEQARNLVGDGEPGLTWNPE
ncbi:MAG: pyridoxamine 5'-phosphate oxidase [Desulfuromonas sp.]|nr:MAG: pyridoxamine 5'-phosphate oxidase [Desulfuromonas sp.]